jgi:hypothetical protein
MLEKKQPKMTRIKLQLLLIVLVLFTLDIKAQNVQLSSSTGSGIETGGKMTQDDHGNIYCFGIFTDTIKLASNIYAVSEGNFDCYIAKFNRYMQVEWLKTIGSTGAEGAGSIAYFDGKLFLGGWYGAQTIINNDTLIYNFDCVSPGFIASLDTSGNFIRAKAFTKTSNSISCFVNAIEVNQTGVVIAGKVKGQFDFGNGQTINTILAGTEHDIFLARFDTTFLCNLALKGSSALGLQYGNDGANALQIDTIGNMYVAGFFGSISSLSNATLYFGGQTLNANGGYGFSDYFVAKIKPNGAAAWLRGSGGSLPDFITNLCLENDTRIAVAGRYSDNSNVGGIPLPPSPGEYSTFLGAIDSAGTGLSAFRVSNEAIFQSLKKGADNYLYAADINNTPPSTRFKIYKIQSDTGILAVDSININVAGNYGLGDIIPPSTNCGEIIINCSFNEVVKYQNDTLIQNNYTQNLYDFFFGKYSISGGLLNRPQITNPISTVFCSNTANINLSTSNITNASDYYWQIMPSNAGSLINNGNNATLNIDSTFAGQIKIVCYAANFCNISDVSDTLVLTINQAPIVYSIDDTGFGAVQSNIVNATNFNWYLDSVLLNFANMPIINCIGDGVYTIIATNGSCSDTLSNFVACIVSNIKQLDQSVVNIYPNPAKGNFTINTTSDELKEFSVYTLTGQLIYNNTFNGYKSVVNMEALSKGYYLIKVKSNSINYTTKLLID